MAASCEVTVIGNVSGLDKELIFPEKFTTTTTPTKAFINRQIQAVADTDEALNLGGISTVELIVLKCVTNDVDVDTSYVSSFVAEITVNEGETAVFKPTGTVRIKNDDAAEVSTVQYMVIGSA